MEREMARAPAAKEVAAAREEHDYQFIDDLVDIKLEAFVAKDEPQGYFRLRILPRADKKLDPLPKDVTFVVDASQSIPQHKLTATAKGVADAVRRLHPQDRFNVVAFRDSPSLFRDTLVQADKANIDAAAEFLRAQESRGATDFYRVLTPVLANAPRPGVPGIVFVVSDGRPTTGLRDSRAIINAATAENRQGNAIFGFGGGNTVNQYLLDLLAYQNRGAAKVVGNVNDMAAGVPAFLALLDDPLLVNLKTEFGRIDTREVFPRELPDFFRARPITLYGRFDAAAPEEFTMRLTGTAEARRKELLFRADLEEAATGDAEIAREWAFAKCYAIIGEMAVDGETPERMEALRSLSARYNIRTSYSE
jgi:Ca-activated chloride channel family protein